MTSRDRQLSRRHVLAGTAGLSAGWVVTSCGFLSTDAEDGDSTAGTKADKESPMLAERVESGELPKLAQRLPTNPMVVDTLEENGIHGGTIRRVLTDPADSTGAMSTICRVGLAEFDLVTYEPKPALAESWKISDNGRTYTFTLRQGIKWSDGKPFTTDDLAFYFDDILGDETLAPAPPTWYVVGGKPGTFTKLDETRFTLEFVAPHALLLKHLAYIAIGASICTPKHYLSQFHPAYKSVDALKQAARKAGFSSWDLYWEDRNNAWLNTERPVLGAWLVTEAAGGAGNHAVMERNPYYWKTDSDGRQLPYIDSITYDYTDTKTFPLKAAGGDLDLQFRLLNYEMMPTLQKSAEDEGYEVRKWVHDTPWIALYMNQSNKDPVKRELMQNRDFRAAMSHAINRDEINQSLFTGLGKLDQPGPIPQDPYYIKGYGRNFIEYDVDKANQLLDSIGLDQRDGDGWRLRADGERLDLGILTFENETGSPTDVYEMVTRYWAEVGVKSRYKIVSSQLWREQVTAGDVDVPGYAVGSFMWDIDAQWFVPLRESSYFAPLYGKWYETGGNEGMEPPEGSIYKQLQDIYDEIKVTTDEKKRVELGREIIRAHDENVFIIGTVAMPFQPVLVSTDLANVKAEAVASYRLAQDEVTWFEQVFYRNPDDH